METKINNEYLEHKIKIQVSLVVLAWDADLSNFGPFLKEVSSRVACCADFLFFINNFWKQEIHFSWKMQSNSSVSSVAGCLDIILFIVYQIVQSCLISEVNMVPYWFPCSFLLLC